MSYSIAHLHYWLVSLFIWIGPKLVPPYSCYTSDHASFNPLSQNLLIPIVKFYFLENIWPNTVASYVLYSIFYSFASTVYMIKLLVWYVFLIIVGSNIRIGVTCRVYLITGCGISSWLICSGGFYSSVSTPGVKNSSLSNYFSSYLSITSLYVISPSMVGSYASSSPFSTPEVEPSLSSFSSLSLHILPYLQSLNFSGDLLPSFFVRASTISITSWVIVIGITLQRDIIFPVNKLITSNLSCSVSNYRRYMTPSFLGVVVFLD